MAGRIAHAVGGDLRGTTVAIFGVTFKPNTDDMREAPSLVIIPMLQERGARIRACDPQGRAKAEALLPGVEWCASALEAVIGADGLVALTEWNEFRALDLKQASKAMRKNVLVDLRNMYSVPWRRRQVSFILGLAGRLRNNSTRPVGMRSRRSGKRQVAL